MKGADSKVMQLVLSVLLALFSVDLRLPSVVHSNTAFLAFLSAAVPIVILAYERCSGDGMAHGVLDWPAAQFPAAGWGGAVVVRRRQAYSLLFSALFRSLLNKFAK